MRGVINSVTNSMNQIFSKKPSLEETRLLTENNNNLLNFTHIGISTVNTRSNDSGLETIHTNGDLGEALIVLKNCIKEGSKLNSLTFQNPWVREDTKRTIHSETVSLDDDLLKSLARGENIESLKHLNLSGYDLCLQKKNGEPRIKTPLRSIVEIIKKSPLLETLSLQNNKLTARDVNFVLVMIRGSKCADLITVDTFSNQSISRDDSINESNQNSIDQALERFIASREELKSSSNYQESDLKPSAEEVLEEKIPNPELLNISDITIGIPSSEMKPHESGQLDQSELNTNKSI